MTGARAVTQTTRSDGMATRFADLMPADIAAHVALGIDEDVLEQARVRRVSDDEGRALLCCNGRPGRMDGIVYPYVSPAHGRTVTYRVRRDHPEDEHGRPKAKYLSPAGDRKHLYFPPGAAERLHDLDIPIVFVESEKAALAVTSLSARTSRPLLAIGLGGCWGWRGRIGKVEDADGERVDESGPLPDLDLVTWAGRESYIAFDANAATNPRVQDARRALARELTDRGAQVRVAELAVEPGINGPDDFIGRHGDTAFLARLDQALKTGVGVTLEDFYAYMPTHTYIFAPGGDMWPGSSVDRRVQPWPTRVDEKTGKPKMDAPSTWLDRHRAVEMMTWAPGLPQVIVDRLIADGGWIDRPGCSTFNLYRPPRRRPGDPLQAGPWLLHVKTIYPDDWPHIAAWLAHRVQRPGEKINHALVLGGHQGIGKDSLLEPVKHAVGPWNFAEVSPTVLLGRFNDFIKSTVLRVSEARDLGDVDRYGFYEHLKTLTAAPPDVLRCDEKFRREYTVFNVTGVIITTNHRTNGIYLPADDRRHYVAWSELTEADFTEDYWLALWRWYEDGGRDHVTAWLEQYDLSTFNAKAPPPKTPAFYDIVAANRAPEDAELADALDALGNPTAVTIGMIAEAAAMKTPLFAESLRDRKYARLVPHRMETAGYVPVRNEGAKDGYWSVSGRRQAIYVRAELSTRERITAAQELVR